jgi:Domain of unknown function (DUF4390)
MAGLTSSLARRLLFVFILALAGPTALYAQSIDVMPLARDGQLFVSFEVRDAFTDDMRAAIASGLKTTFAYEIQLRRSSTIWVDRTLDEARVLVEVKYDNLTRRYQVSIMQDGRVTEARVTENPDEVRSWATEFRRLPLFSTRRLEPNAEYYLRVRAETKPRNSWVLLPWDRATALGTAKFTFLP